MNNTPYAMVNEDSQAFSRSGFSDFRERTGTLVAPNRQEDHVVVDRAAFSGNNQSGYRTNPPVDTLTATDSRRTTDKLVVETTHVAPTEVTGTLMVSSGRGSPEGDHLAITVTRAPQVDDDAPW